MVTQASFLDPDLCNQISNLLSHYDRKLKYYAVILGSLFGLFLIFLILGMGLMVISGNSLFWLDDRFYWIMLAAVVFGFAQTLVLTVLVAEIGIFLLKSTKIEFQIQPGDPSRRYSYFDGNFTELHGVYSSTIQSVLFCVMTLMLIVVAIALWNFHRLITPMLPDLDIEGGGKATRLVLDFIRPGFSRIVDIVTLELILLGFFFLLVFLLVKSGEILVTHAMKVQEHPPDYRDTTLSMRKEIVGLAFISYMLLREMANGSLSEETRSFTRSFLIFCITAIGSLTVTFTLILP